MSDACCGHEKHATLSPAYRRVLWIALGVNAAMFVIEVFAGFAAGSVSLQADALDFLGDAANYAISLTVLTMSLSWRARAALLKGATMGGFGLWVLAAATINLVNGRAPDPMTMGAVGFLALAANLGVAALLYRFREGDANMRSVWLCTRNDAIGNVAVMAAALGVFGTGGNWPDIVVAAVMASLALSAAFEIIRRSAVELKRVGNSLPSLRI